MAQMPATLPAGPYKTVETGNGPAPWYIIPFDKHGTCTGPLTRKDLLGDVSGKKFSDVFIFSHGWNNDWEAASNRYESFIAGFIKLRTQFGLEPPPDYRPLLVGIVWPSTALVMPWEQGPKFAGSDDSSKDAESASWQRELETIGADVESDTREEFYALAQTPSLSDAQAARLAEILSHLVEGYTQADAEIANAETRPPSGPQLLERAKQLGKKGSRSRVPGKIRAIDDSGGMPQAAFGLSDLDPRGLVRTATVLQMKDRAGIVGKNGVAPLLRDTLKADSSLKVHLIGHSYGAIVVLSALCNIPSADFTTQVSSVLLLQPAVSQWCFAADVDGEGFAGGYRPALERVSTPILTSFSKHDTPLTKMFHLAVRRDRDKGQPRMAAAGAELPHSPSPYAALGGFGPAGLTPEELQVVDITTPVSRYSFRDPAPKVVALRGDQAISGHGEISVPATWWALFQQVESLVSAT